MESETHFTMEGKTFKYITDLEYFDGALLSVFSEISSNTPYILHWIDINETTLRWLFFPTTPRALGLYLEEKLSNQDLLFLDNSPTVKIIDLNGDMKLHKVETVDKKALPEKYTPYDKGFFKKELCFDIKAVHDYLGQFPKEVGETKKLVAA